MKTAITVIAFCLIFALSINGDVRACEDYPSVTISVGEVFSICESGKVVCPVRNPICDDPGVISLVDTSRGLGFKGKSEGSTICSVVPASGPRYIFRITVR